MPDDNKFEIDKATCSDGANWDFDLDSSYKVIKKEKKSLYLLLIMRPLI